MPNVFKYNPTSTEVQSLRVGDIYIGVGDVAKGPTTLTGFKNGPNLGTSSTAIIMNRDTGTFSWYINFTDQELISRTNRIDPTGINLITNNPTPTTNTTGYAVVGGVGTLTFDAGESAIRWLRTSYESWGAYVWNNSIQNYVFDKFSNYTATFEWKFGPSHSANESYNFEIINGPGTYIVLRVGLTASSTLQESGWYRFTRVSKPLQDGVGQTIQYRILRASTSGITDIYWRNLEYYKTTRTTKEECSSYFAGQSDKMLLNKDYESIVTDGLVLNFDAGFLPSYPGTGSSWYDLGPGQNNGTLQNGPTFDSGGWINFDGSNDYTTIPDNASLDFSGSSATLTSELLINLDVYRAIEYLNAKGQSGVASQNNYNFIITESWVYFRVGNGTTTINSPFGISPSNLPVGRWGHIVAVLDTTHLRLYLNGNQIGTGTSRTIDPVSNNDNYFIASSQYPFDGKIAISRLYNRNLSQTEILQNYYKGSIVTDGLNIYYDAGNLVSYDRVGVTWSNLSGTGSSGVLNNGATFSEIRGGSIIFDGVNDNFAATNTILQISSAFSIEYAVSILTVPTSSYKYIFRNGQGYQSNGVYAEFGPGYLSLCTVNSTASAASVYLFSPGSNTLYYVSVTYENRSLKGYVNGVLVQTNNISFDPLNSSQTTLNIGQNGEFTIPLWRFYTRALSLSEVKQNFHANRTRLGL